MFRRLKNKKFHRSTLMCITARVQGNSVKDRVM